MKIMEMKINYEDGRTEVLKGKQGEPIHFNLDKSKLSGFTLDNDDAKEFKFSTFSMKLDGYTSNTSLLDDRFRTMKFLLSTFRDYEVSMEVKVLPYPIPGFNDCEITSIKSYSSGANLTHKVFEKVTIMKRIHHSMIVGRVEMGSNIIKETYNFTEADFAVIGEEVQKSISRLSTKLRDIDNRYKNFLTDIIAEGISKGDFKSGVILNKSDGTVVMCPLNGLLDYIPLTELSKYFDVKFEINVDKGSVKSEEDSKTTTIDIGVTVSNVHVLPKEDNTYKTIVGNGWSVSPAGRVVKFTKVLRNGNVRVD